MRFAVLERLGRFSRSSHGAGCTMRPLRHKGREAAMTLLSTLHAIRRQGPRLWGARRPRRQGRTRRQAAIECLEGRALLSHVATEFSIQSPDGNGSDGHLAMTFAPDGNLWFIDEIFPGSNTDGVQIGMMTQSGTITWYPPLSTGSAEVFSGYITTGPGGSIWFGVDSDFGEIMPNGAMTLYPAPSIAPYISGLTAGPDGNIWFTASQNNYYTTSATTPSVVGRITPAGQITTFSVLAGPLGDQVTTSSIVQGNDGKLWFAARIPAGGDNTELEMASVTSAGQITLHPIEAAGPVGWTDAANGLGYNLTRGPDGNPWLLVGGLNKGQNNTGYVKSEILRIDPSGKFKRFPIPLASNRQLNTITSGPGNKLYFTIEDETSNSDMGAEPAIGDLSTSGRTSFASIPSSDTPGAGSYQNPMTLGPDGKLWFVGGVLGGDIVRLNSFNPTKPGHDPFPPPPWHTGIL
jgi:virginiamycin B lyase